MLLEKLGIFQYNLSLKGGCIWKYIIQLSGAFILTQVSAKRMVSIILPAFRVWDGNREDILTTIKIFQFLHRPYCISGQYVLCRRKNLIVHKYNNLFLAAKHPCRFMNKYRTFLFHTLLKLSVKRLTSLIQNLLGIAGIRINIVINGFHIINN